MPSWDSLEAYISNYSGRTKIQRLQWISKSDEELRVSANRLLLSTLQRETLDCPTYQATYELLMSLSADAAADFDTNWPISANRKAQALTDKLEQELKAYKNNLIKESIRMGQQDLASHFVQLGQLTDALRALVRNRDYCTTPTHLYQVNMGIVNISILLGQWTQAQVSLSRIDTSTAQLKEPVNGQDHLHAATALSLLGQGQFEQAAMKLVQISPTITNTYNEVISMNDVANFTSILALATFPRDRLIELGQSPSFKPFLELEINAREMLVAFSQNRYADCFKLLEIVKADLSLDIYFAPHVPEVFQKIRERCLTQYISAFTIVPLRRISEVFSLSMSMVEDAIVDLIANSQLSNASIERLKGCLMMEQIAPRKSVYSKTFQISRDFHGELDRALVQLALNCAGLTVDEKRKGHDQTSIPGNNDLEKRLTPDHRINKAPNVA